MQNIQKNLTELNQLILQGKALEAFDKYYDDDVIMQENNDTPTLGKAANRDREIEFFSKVTELRKMEVINVGFGENVSFAVWHWDYTHADWGKRDYTQVAVQRWKDGKIIKEQFFYGN